MSRQRAWVVAGAAIGVALAAHFVQQFSWLVVLAFAPWLVVVAWTLQRNASRNARRSAAFALFAGVLGVACFILPAFTPELNAALSAVLTVGAGVGLLGWGFLLVAWEALGPLMGSRILEGDASI
jgi:hypothetical protein